MSKVKRVIRDAEEAGLEIVRKEGVTHVITKRDGRRHGAPADGLSIYENGTAIRIGIDLAVASGIRSTAEMRSVLGLSD